MLYALVSNIRTHISDAPRGTIGYDPWHPQIRVIARKGEFRQFWRYLDPVPEFPSGYEQETEWHVAWKSRISPEYCEVVVGDNREHRADILTLNHAIEIQQSPIDYRVAEERTKFYYDLTGRRVLWICNIFDAFKDKRFHTILIPESDGIFEVFWKRKKLWVAELAKLPYTNVFLDLSPSAKNLILMWQHQGHLYGKWVQKADFYTTYLRDVGVGKEAFLKKVYIPRDKA